jgi:wyosine [tRNA(Phe)-imidazoG37] synthetase (radical SAM superfamily)
MQAVPLLPLHHGTVYGPVRSRRLGRSLGINVFPAGRKICNFNCLYCQYGWTREDERSVRPEEWPAPAAIAGDTRAALQQKTGGRIDRITLAGNGEPTLHPGICEVVERLRVVRDEVAPSARLVVLSNSGTLNRPPVVSALHRLDEVYMKLDAAHPDVFRRLNGAGDDRLPSFRTLRALPHVTIQSLFTRDEARRVDNTAPEALGHWLEALRIIRPAAVHIYTIDRQPAWRALMPIPRAELMAIADRVRVEGIAAHVF